MAMLPIQKLKKQIERANIARVKQRQRRKDIQNLKDAGIWKDPRTKYLNQYGFILPGAPQWWLNLRGAWETNDRKALEKRRVQSSESKEPAIKPTRKKRYKKVDRKPKIKHSEKMRLLLEDHGIYVDQNNMLSDNFSNWKFCINGRLQRKKESTISVFYFLQHHADI